MTEVSVIIPTNRVNGWLDEAIESTLVGQSVDLETVVVLDGVELSSRPAWLADPRVRVLTLPENVGQTVAMNTGVRASRGELIARLDSDDVASPGRFEKQRDYLLAHPSAVAVGSAVVRIDENSKPTGPVRLPVGPDVRHELLLSNVVSHSSLMFRRSVFEELTGYDERLRQMEDYEFILRLAMRGEIANLQDELIGYRVHSTQTSRGAAPTGTHIDAVAHARIELGRSLGASPLTTRGKLALWRGMQFLRFSGVIRPGHER